MVGCGGGGAVDGVSGVRGQADSGGAVPEYEGLGGVHAAASWEELYLEQRIQFWGLAGVRDNEVGLSGGDHGQGFDSDGVFCAIDRSAGKDGAGVGEKRGCGGI